MFRFLFPEDKAIAKEVATLAYPVVLSNLSRVLMSISDVAMVGRLGAEALAATGMGAMMFWAVLSLVLGIRTAVQTVASRRLGQKIEQESGTAFHNGLIMATTYGIPMSFFGWLFARDVVPFFIKNPIATPLAIDYTTIVFAGMIFSAYSFVFQGFYTGIEKTKIHMTVTIISNIINVYLNAAFIYGYQGIKDFFVEIFPQFSFLSYIWKWASFPAMGVKGAAIATIIASMWMALHYFFYLFSKDLKQRFGVFSFRPNRTMMKRQIMLAVPMGLQESLIAFGWTVFYKIVGIIGLIELATTELLFTIMHASFMPAFGFGQACSTLVSKYMGENKIEKSVSSIKESVRLAEYFMGFMGLTFIFFPGFYLSIFTNDPVIIDLGSFGLRVIGAVQFLDAVGFVMFFALAGAGNTFFPSMVESCLTWVVIVFGTYYFGVVLDLGYIVPWFLLPIYMGLFAAILTWKIYQGDWKNIKV